MEHMSHKINTMNDYLPVQSMDLTSIRRVHHRWQHRDNGGMLAERTGASPQPRPGSSEADSPELTRNKARDTEATSIHTEMGL